MAQSQPINQPMGAIEWLLLSALSVLWGGTFLFAEIALAEVRSFTLVLGRVGFAALILIAVVYASGRRMPRDASAWGAFLIMGARIAAGSKAS
jgi:drug/metabolite transporter (DMT)-like permease